MKRLSTPLIIVWLLLVCGGSKKESLEIKHPNRDQPRQIQPEEPEIKEAAPEDLGPPVTVFSPLAILKEQAQPPPIKPAEKYVRYEPMLVDHPIDFPLQKPKTAVHQVFPVNKYAQFSFVAPPHQGNTRLRGAFRSFTKRSDPDASSDRTADVDLMLLNEQQFNQFLHGQPQSVTYELDSAHDQIVDWRVPTTYGKPQTYHLVFTNSGSGPKIRFVEADFTVSFE